MAVYTCSGEFSTWKGTAFVVPRLHLPFSLNSSVELETCCDAQLCSI